MLLSKFRCVVGSPVVISLGKWVVWLVLSMGLVVVSSVEVEESSVSGVGSSVEMEGVISGGVVGVGGCGWWGVVDGIMEKKFTM